MPRVYPPKRTAISIRLSPERLAEVDKLAEAAKLTRSKMIRKLLAEALAARRNPPPRVTWVTQGKTEPPPGWKP